MAQHQNPPAPPPLPPADTAARPQGTAEPQRPLPAARPAAVVNDTSRDSLAVVGMCCGIAGTILAGGSFLVSSMFTGLVAVLALAVCGVGLFLALLSPARDRLRMTAIVLNGCGLAIGLLSIVLVAVAAAQAARQMNDMSRMLQGLQGLEGLDF